MHLKLVGGTFFLVVTDLIIPVESITYIEFDAGTINVYYNNGDSSFQILPEEKAAFLKLFEKDCDESVV